MKTKQLGNSDLFITPTGYGTWAIGGSGWQFGWGHQNDGDSIAAIHRALELGVNWIDTAAVYGLGHSEVVVAKALDNWSWSRPYVFTKCGLRWDARGRTHRMLTAASIRQECEDSLRRLKVEAIDLYQIHWPVEEFHELEEGWSMMAKLQKAGKVRWIGVSNFDVEQMQRAQAIAPITSLQPRYSLVHPEVEHNILPFCEQQSIGVIAYSPMASGLLTGAMTRERIARLAYDDWRKNDEDFQEPKLTNNLALMERLRSVGKRSGHEPGPVAVAWTLRHPAVTAAIVGARKPAQVDDMVAAASVQLSEPDLVEIETGTRPAGGQIKNIGFVGLGIMGSRMAANLQKSGYSLVVFNRTRDKADALVADGAKWVGSPAALSSEVDIVFTMLAHPEAVEEAALGQEGFLPHLRPGQMWIDCSTVNPSFSKRMAAEAQARGIRFLGAPVTGSKGHAAAAKLTFWVGGEAADLDACRPLLECLGNKIVHCGGQGMGTSLKMVMNQLLGTGMAAFAEGLVLGEGLGLSREVLLGELLGGQAAAPFLALKRERMESGNYDHADFPLQWLQKDLHLAAVSAHETGTAMPLTNAAKETYRLAIREGHGNEDFSAIYSYLSHSPNPQPRVTEYLNWFEFLWNQHRSIVDSPDVVRK